MATPSPRINEDAIVRKFETNRGEFLVFAGDDDVSRISKEAKYGLLAGYCITVNRFANVDIPVIET